MGGRSVWDLQSEPKASCCKSHTDRPRIFVLKVRMHLNNHVNQLFW